MDKKPSMEGMNRKLGTIVIKDHLVLDFLDG